MRTDGVIQVYALFIKEPRRTSEMIYLFKGKTDAIRAQAAAEVSSPEGTKFQIRVLPYFAQGFPPRPGGAKRKTSRKKKKR